MSTADGGQREPGCGAEPEVSISEAVRLCFACDDPEQYYDITVSTGRCYRGVMVHWHLGLVVISECDNEFPTMVVPTQIVSIAISARTWEVER